MRSEKGYVDAETLGAGLLVLIPIFFVILAVFTGFQFSNEVVSGIAYNTRNDRFISGATTFSVRASEDTYITEENQSSYCLPPNSQYKELVNKAAQDKRVKIIVEAKKYFAFKAPWTCYPNVTVKEVK